MWVRDGDSAETAARFDFGNALVVEESNAIPEQISSGRLEQQSALADCKFRFGADAQKQWRFLFEAIVMISREPFERRPFLTGVPNELPFIFANKTVPWRIGGFGKLRSALHANKVFHEKNCSAQSASVPCATPALPARS